MTERKKPRSRNTSSDKDLHLEVAERRLRESTDQSDALHAIREIVTNLLGSEEIAIFKVGPTQAILSLFWSFGFDAAPHATLDPLRSPILRRVLEGEPYLEGAFEGEEKGDAVAGFNVLVPIRLASRTEAVLAIRSLLPQKTCFDESDVRLVHLLAGEAGKALFRERSGLDA
jgi:hypothetical protein